MPILVLRYRYNESILRFRRFVSKEASNGGYKKLRKIAATTPLIKMYTQRLMKTKDIVEGTGEDCLGSKKCSCDMCGKINRTRKSTLARKGMQTRSVVNIERGTHGDNPVCFLGETLARNSQGREILLEPLYVGGQNAGGELVNSHHDDGRAIGDSNTANRFQVGSVGSTNVTSDPVPPAPARDATFFMGTNYFVSLGIVNNLILESEEDLLVPLANYDVCSNDAGVNLIFSDLNRSSTVLDPGWRCITSFELSNGDSNSVCTLKQLNGSSGEFTNSDDMAKKGDKKLVNDENCRRNKEAQTNRHRGNNSQSRNPNNAAQRVNRQRNKQKQQAEQQVKSEAIVAAEEAAIIEEQVETNNNQVAPGVTDVDTSIDVLVGGVPTPVVEQQEQPEKIQQYFPALELCDMVIGFTINTDFKFLSNFRETDKYKEIPLMPGTVGSWVRDGNKGYYINSGKHQIPAPYFVLEKTVRSFEYLYHDGSKKYKDISKHRVFTPLHKLLLNRWQRPKYSLSVETAMRNFIAKTISESASDLPGVVVDEVVKLFAETFDFYLFTWIAQDQNIILEENVDPMKNPSYVFKTAWYNQHVITQHDTFIKMDVRPRVIDVSNLKCKGNIEILSPIYPKSFTFDKFDFFMRALHFDYDPDYSRSQDLLTKHYVSVGMDLIPGCWDRSDTSDTRSYLVALCKRLMAQRDNEQVLWLNQQRWLADVANRFGPSSPDIYDLLGVELQQHDGVYYYLKDPYYGNLMEIDARLPNPHHKHKAINICSVGVGPNFVQDISPVLDVIDQFIFDTSRYAPAKIKDMLNTSAQAMVDGAFTCYAWLYSLANNREDYARLPGPKRQQRIRIVDSVKYMPVSGNCNVTAYLKDELDKLNPNKPSRIFTSYGKESSFLDPALIGVVKKRISGRISRTYKWKYGMLNVDCYTFTTPRTTDLEHLFKEMANIHSRPNTIVFGCFSDDSVIAWNLPSGIGYANVDISSCDSSNGPLLFEIVGRCLMQLCPESGFAYLKQCRQKIHCVNPQNPSQWFKIIFPSCFEGSGTSLTTILNTIASALICFGIIEILLSNPDLSMDEAIIKGAALVGHKVTVDHCLHQGRYVLEKIQFLKFSPMFTTEKRLIPVRNTGCIIRGLGKIFGDLTPKQIGLDDNAQAWNILSASERFDRYISAVIAGYKNEPHHPLLDGLRRRFTVPIAASPPAFVEMDGDYSSCEVAMDSYMLRYNITPQDYLHQFNLVQELRLGSVVVYTPFLNAMEQDYGMDKREASPTEGTFSNMGVEFKTPSTDSPPVPTCLEQMSTIISTSCDNLSRYTALIVDSHTVTAQSYQQIRRLTHQRILHRILRQ